MAGKKSEIFINLSQIPGVQKYWKGFLAFGILLIALGLLAIGYVNWATEVTVILLGFLLVKLVGETTKLGATDTSLPFLD